MAGGLGRRRTGRNIDYWGDYLRIPQIYKISNNLFIVIAFHEFMIHMQVR